MQNLDRLKQLGVLAKDSTSAFWQYYHAGLSDGAIPKKYPTSQVAIRSVAK